MHNENLLKLRKKVEPRVMGPEMQEWRYISTPIQRVTFDNVIIEN